MYLVNLIITISFNYFFVEFICIESRYVNDNYVSKLFYLIMYLVNLKITNNFIL